MDYGAAACSRAPEFVPQVAALRASNTIDADNFDSDLDWTVADIQSYLNPSGFPDGAGPPYPTPRDQATVLLLLHELTLGKRGGGAVGPLTGERVGPLGRSYGMQRTGSWTTTLNLTTWGMQFQQLAMQQGLTSAVVL